MSMDPKNCKACGKVFFSSGTGVLCQDCAKKDEENFQIVRAFLKEFPGSKITAVVEITGISEKKILRYLREGRLELMDISSDFLTCVKCGEPIKSGIYCNNCYKKYGETVKSLFVKSSEPADDVSAKMHIRLKRMS